MTVATKTRRLLAVALLCGCAGEAPRPSASVVDSAGIEIVTAVTPDGTDESGWALGSEPDLEVRDASGEDPYLFESIVAASRSADGSTLVCNGGDRTLRRYDRDGSFLGQAGGQGGGPSELRRLSRCFRVDVEVWAYQAPFQPIKVYGEGGAFVRAVPMPRPGGRAATLVDVLADGALLLRQDAPRRELPEGVGPVAATVIVAAAPSEASSLDTLAVTVAIAGSVRADSPSWLRSRRRCARSSRGSSSS